MILSDIADRTRQRIADLKKAGWLEQVKAQACILPADTGFPFETAIRKSGLSFICEIKKASPSLGLISNDYPYRSIARDYEEAGAAAISVLTEPCYFLGEDRHLSDIVQTVDIPVLRKDFTVDDGQIYEAKCLGASAILLIVALLDVRTLAGFIESAHSLGLSALVEAHTAAEIESALRSGARIVGVNNRDLETFRVDLATSLRLRHLVPPGVLFVSESGIRTAEDIAALRRIGADAVLIGETLMRSPDKGRQLAVLRGETG